jgi:hypothetical protein
MINYNKGYGAPYYCSKYDCNGMPLDCPDFTIKRHDTKPVFKVDVTDCDAPIDLTGLVIEASMWLNTKIKSAMTTLTSAIQFADNIGFEQINENTIIQIGDNRKFERMLVDYIDEENKTVYVFRGQLGTNIYTWKKGSCVKLLRFLNNTAEAELEYQDVTNLDGTVEENVLVRSTLIYQWLPEDTCFWGKYYLEFKVMEVDGSTVDPGEVASGMPNYHCNLGAGVVWTRRFPSNKEGFLIEVFNSPSAE